MKALMNKLLLSFLVITLFNSCKSNEIITLQNDKLKVGFYSKMPVFKSITYLEETLKPSIGKGLSVNGEMKNWDNWVIKSGQKGDTLVYNLSLNEPKIKADFVYWLESSSIKMKIRNVEDKNNILQDIGLQDQPWVSVKDTSYHWWTVKNWTREPFVAKKVFSRGIGMYNTIMGNGQDTIQEKGQPYYACIWNKNKLCVALKTNMEVYPIRMWSDASGCNLAPNKYYYKVKDLRLPDYEAELTFISDLNENKVFDKGDYFVWSNRQLKGTDQLHKDALWYKVKISNVENKDNPSTNLAQTRVIFDYFKNITDNIPQIIYLVGWQYDGHDTGYPAFDKLNHRMGTRQELDDFSKYCENLGSVLSIHNNMDDAYVGNKYYSPDIMASDYNGTPMFWEIFADSASHISHYKDVKTGMIFKRLDELLKTFPIQRSIHFDAMRVTNCNPEWEKEKIGVLEEYYLGLKPISEWFRKKGILITTETQNGNPIDLSPMISAIWSNFRLTTDYRQIYHGKVIGGGIAESEGISTRFFAGLGNSISQDFSYKKYPELLDYETQKVHMKELIYLNTILYKFFLSKEMLEVEYKDGGYKLRFSDAIVSIFDKKTNHLKVTWKDVVIAEDDERFVPVFGGIYVYSKNGAERDWILPLEFRNKNLKIYELTETGRKGFTNYKISENKITIHLIANQSVKIVVE